MADKTQDTTSELVEELKLQAALAENKEEDANSASLSSGAAFTNDSGYEWDPMRQGWFPKVDEDFIAAYQMSYGFTTAEQGDSTTESSSATATSNTTTSSDSHDRQPVAGQPEKQESAETENTTDSKKDDKGKKRKANDEGWFEMDQNRNPNVYVSGLPLDITEEEFIEMMSKYGIIMEDTETQKPKIKVYRDEKGNPKGDARCCYLKMASVELAIELLDESHYRDKTVLHVEQAEFHMKGSYNPALKKKKKKKKKKQNKQQEKLLDWVERDDRRPKHERIVVLKNMFNPKDFEKDPRQVLSLRNDLKKECEKYGDVRKVIVFDRNSEGICSVAFKEHPPADACVEVMNGRWFAGRRLVATKWDGVSNFKVEETEKDLKDRMKTWEQYLLGEDEDEKPATETAAKVNNAEKST